MLLANSLLFDQRLALTPSGSSTAETAIDADEDEFALALGKIDACTALLSELAEVGAEEEGEAVGEIVEGGKRGAGCAGRSGCVGCARDPDACDISLEDDDDGTTFFIFGS